MKEQYRIKTVHRDGNENHPLIFIDEVIKDLRGYCKVYGLEQPSNNYLAAFQFNYACEKIVASIDFKKKTISFAFKGRDEFLILKVL